MMHTVTDVLIDGKWLTQKPNFGGQMVRETTYFDDGKFGVVEYSYRGESVDDMRITRLGFLDRFTDAEAIAIDLSSIGVTVEAASIRRFVAKVNAAQYIDLAREDTIAGVNALEQMGLIDEGRALEILSPPVTDDERYEG